MKKSGIFCLSAIINIINSLKEKLTSLFIPVLLLLTLPLSSKAQITNSELLKTNIPAQSDTVTLTIEQAEALLQQHNLLLIAQKYSIDQARAQVLQSR